MDLANVMAGAYKGYMNAAGQEVSSTYLAVVLASTSLCGGVATSFMCGREGSDLARSLENPATKGLKVTLLRIPLGALEITLGYGLGYVAYKVVS